MRKRAVIALTVFLGCVPPGGARTKKLAPESAPGLVQKLLDFRRSFVFDEAPIAWCSVVAVADLNAADFAKLVARNPAAFTPQTQACPPHENLPSDDYLVLRSIRAVGDSVFVVGERKKGASVRMEEYLAERSYGGFLFTRLTLGSFYYLEFPPPPPPPPPSLPSAPRN